MKLHDEIYPDPTELNNIKNLVKVTEDNLKTISDTMRDETEAELKDKGFFLYHCDVWRYGICFMNIECEFM
jgi:hypothetical protein